MVEMPENPLPEVNREGIQRAAAYLLFALERRLCHIPRRAATKDMAKLRHRWVHKKTQIEKISLSPDSSHL